MPVEEAEAAIEALVRQRNLPIAVMSVVLHNQRQFVRRGPKFKKTSLHSLHYLLRQDLAAFQVQPAAVLALSRHGQLVRASGLVTHRQRPETAKGVVFVTLEDETGAVNVIVWPQVAQAQRKPLLAATLLTVYGIWQAEGEVRHLIARKLVDHSGLLQGLSTRSRNFR